MPEITTLSPATIDPANDLLIFQDVSTSPDTLKTTTLNNALATAATGLAVGAPITGGGVDRMLYEDSSQNIAASGLFIPHDGLGTLAVVYGGGAGNGFLVMPAGSNRNNVEYGPWVGGMLYDGVGGRGFGMLGRSGEPDLWVDNSTVSHDHGGQTWPDSCWIFGDSAPSVGFKLVIQAITDDDTTYGLGVVNRSRTLTHFTIRSDGQVGFDKTNTAAGTTGDQTIHKASGKVNFAASATSLTVTNNKCQTSSIVLATVLSNDTTAYIKNVVPSNGSFLIHLGAAASAETPVGWLLIN